MDDKEFIASPFGKARKTINSGNVIAYFHPENILRDSELHPTTVGLLSTANNNLGQ